MNPSTLHFPARPGLARWVLAALATAAAHAAIAAAIALWYARTPPEPHILPAIAVSLAPVMNSSPQVEDQDAAVGPTMQQAEQTPPEPPKVEEQKPIEQVTPPPPQQQAEVTLPKPDQPKPIEQPKPEPRPPAPETRAPPKGEHVAQFSQAASNVYNSLVYGHLQRFKRYPSAARGAPGTVTVRFALNRAGDVVASSVTKSSGNSVLDQEALEILRRASPFPPFPAAKPGAQDSFIAPVSFSR
jgi:protein TonB